MTWWHYLLLANVYLTLFFVFYALFLRKETFFNLNRVYLVSSAILSFLIPVIQSNWIKGLFITQRVQETFHQVNTDAFYQFTVTATPMHQLTLGQIILGIYLTGIVVLMGRFFYQLAVINWSIHQLHPENTYSFFNHVIIEERDSDNSVIIAHEETHARQWHSVDVLLMEAIMIVNWFNPVVYLYRNAVKFIHEFIADRNAVNTGTNKAEYAMLLLSQTFSTPPHRLVNPFFNNSLLKQRILMLQKNKSHWMMLVKYGLSAPLFALMLVLSSATVNNSKTLQVINNTAERAFTTPVSANFGRLSQQDMEDLNTVIKQHAAPVPANGAPLNTNISLVVPARGAEFPGGMQALGLFLSKNIHYPTEARTQNIHGTVYVSFIVEKNGSITNAKVLRGIGSGADEEALRVIYEMPKWNPGMQNGRTVRQSFTIPINFILAQNTVSFNNQSKPIVDTTSTRFKTVQPVNYAQNERRPDSTVLEGRFVSKVKPQVAAFVAETRLLPKMPARPAATTSGNKMLNGLKDKAVRSIYSEKAANSVVTMITKRRPFYDQDELNN